MARSAARRFVGADLLRRPGTRWQAGGGGGGAPAYNPLTALPNLRLALDAATVTLVGADVDVWPDQSGLGQDFSAASAGVRPLYAATGFNGGSQPYVEADGVSEWLRDTAFSMGGNYSAVTVIAVRQHVSITNGRWLWSGSSSLRPLAQQLVGPNREGVDFRAGSSLNVTTGTTPECAFYWLDSTTTNRQINNGTPDSLTHAVTTLTDSGGVWGLFARHDTGAANIHARLAAFYICRAALTAGERADFYAYASARWGV
jgi:hypothetical protein